MPRLFTLLVGINAYEFPVTPLQYCLNDVRVLEGYFASLGDQFISISQTVLTDERATKSRILDSWNSALDQADPGDSVVFYYSGHGTRETADPAFHEIDGLKQFEALVCFDSVRETDEGFVYNLLCDKEINYLISSCTADGVHVLVIVDSCHSGSITRNAFNGNTTDIRKRQFEPAGRLGFTAPMRQWEDFNFGHDIAHADVVERGWFSIVPKRQHIAISACQQDESAYEKDGHGVFTRHLLAVLRRTERAISYRTLQTRVRHFVRNDSNQTPTIYSTRGNSHDLMTGFLGTPVDPANSGISCYWKKGTGWSLDIGAAHGVTDSSGPAVIRDGTKRITAEVDAIEASHTQIRGKEGILDKTRQYYAQLLNYPPVKTCFFVAPELSAIAGDLRKALEEYPSRGTTELVPDALGAQYAIGKYKSCIAVFPQGMRQYPVLTLPDNPHMVRQLAGSIAHISRWEYLKSFDNPDVQGRSYPVEVSFDLHDADGETRPVIPVNEVLEVPFRRGMGLRICLTNSSETKYYCSLLYLTSTFGVTADLFEEKVVGLQPGRREYVYEDGPVPLAFEPFEQALGVPYSTSFIKLVANTEPFGTDHLEMNDLPPPDAMCGAARGLAIDRRGETAVIPWFTRTFKLLIRNPGYSEP